MMEKADASNLHARNAELVGADAEMDKFKHSVDELSMKVDQLEQRVNEVEWFCSSKNVNQPSTSQGTSSRNNKDRERHVPGFKKLQQDASRREAAAAKRMQDLMRQFGSILRQITQHKWAWPFMQPVDVEGLGLDDYYEVEHLASFHLLPAIHHSSSVLD